MTSDLPLKVHPILIKRAWLIRREWSNRRSAWLGSRSLVAEWRATCAAGLIPSPIDYDPYSHARIPMETGDKVLANLRSSLPACQTWKRLPMSTGCNARNIFSTVGVVFFFSTTLDFAVQKAARSMMTGAVKSGQVNATQYQSTVFCPMLMAAFDCTKVIINVKVERPAAQAATATGYSDLVH